MRSYEYVIVEGQAVRVPVVVCAGGGVVVRAESGPFAGFDAFLLARSGNVALRKNQNAGLLQGKDGAAEKKCASVAGIFILFINNLSNAVFRSRDRNTALRKVHSNTEFRDESRAAATLNNSTTSAEFALSQRIHANGS
jgi:hypothetical protein